jgi:hypothetical protein
MMMTTLTPIKRPAFGRLFFNKTMAENLDNIHNCIDALAASRLVDTFTTCTLDGMAVDMARNQIVLKAIKNGNDAIIWLDTDMLYPSDAMVRLVEMANAGHMIAAGIYRRNVPPYSLLVQDEAGSEISLDDIRSRLDGGVVEVPIAAGGYSIVRMEVYKTVRIPWYCNWDFVSSQGQVGEDKFFVCRAREAGFRVVVDPELHAIHWGRFGPIPVEKSHPSTKAIMEAILPNATHA